MSALMSQFDIARESLNTALNGSAGSAERELENYQKGIQYSIDRITASFQEFSTTLVDSNLFKGIVDGGNEVLNVVTSIIDKFGGLQTAISGVATYFLTKNGLGKQIMFQNMFNSI